MSVSKCKCDKIFDTDNEPNYDEKGDCCCDNCFEEMAQKFENDLTEAYSKCGLHINEASTDTIGSIVDALMHEGYRKIK